MGDLPAGPKLILSRLSRNDHEDDHGVPEKANWYWLTKIDLDWSRKTGPRPYLRLSQEDVGTVTVYPRTTLKGEAPIGKHVPDQPYPRGVRHQAHRHLGSRCRLNADATVLAYAPQPVGAYVLRRLAQDCDERDSTWLSKFRKALRELEDSGGKATDHRC